MKAAIGLVFAVGLAVGGWALFSQAPANQHLLVTEALARPLPDGTAAAFLAIENRGAPDRLVSVSASGAGAGMVATLYSPQDPDGPPVPVGTSALALDGAHIRLTPDGRAGGGPAGDGALVDGALVPLTLTFAEAGEVALRVRLSDPAKTGAASEVGLFGLGDICIVGADEPAPAVSLVVSETPQGWTVDVVASEFAFSEEYLGLFHVPGMGHGHLYVGGMKLGRLFSTQAQIGALPPGRHEVRVTLNTNDHRAYVVDGTPVTATAWIEVDAPRG